MNVPCVSGVERHPYLATGSEHVATRHGWCRTPHARTRAAAATLAVAALMVAARAAPSAAAGGEAVRAQGAPDPGLDLIDQTFAVTPGGEALFEFLVTTEVPDIVAPPTAAATTTTATTTTTTTGTTATSAPPGAIVAAAPPTAAPVPAPATTVEQDADQSVDEATGTDPELIVQVRAHRVAQRRSDIADAFATDVLPVSDLVEFELADVITVDPATGERRIRLAVPISDRAVRGQLELPDPGVYPITIQIRRNGQLIVTHLTFVERLRTDGFSPFGPFSIAALAAVDDVSTFPTDDELERGRSQLGALADVAERTTVPLTVSIPPALVNTVFADDPELAARVSSALAGDVLLAAPDLPLEPGAAAAAGLENEFARRLREGEGALVARIPGASTQRSIWVDHGDLTAPAAELVRDNGVQLLVLPYDEYAQLQGSRPGLTDTSLLVATSMSDDTSLSIALVDPVMSLVDPDRVTGNTPAEDAVRLMAEIGALRTQLEPQPRSFVLATPDLGIPDPDVLTYVERFATEHPDVEFQPLAALPGLTNPFVVDGEWLAVELPTGTPVNLQPRVEAEAIERLRLSDVASMLAETDPRPAAWDATLRASVTTGITEDAGFGLIERVRQELLDVRDAIQPAVAFPFTMTGRETEFPIKIENAGDTPLDIVVHIESDRLSFPQNDLPVTVPANATIDVPVDVVARANGRFPVRIELNTPAGNLLAEPTVVSARVNNLTGLGRVVTVGLGLVLVTWWFSYFSRRRRAARTVGLAGASGRHPANGPHAASAASDDPDGAARQPLADSGDGVEVDR